jgi:hypothetical protein
MAGIGAISRQYLPLVSESMCEPHGKSPFRPRRIRSAFANLGTCFQSGKWLLTLDGGPVHQPPTIHRVG